MSEEKIKIIEGIDSYSPVIDGVINVAKNYSYHLNKTEECVLIAPAAGKKDNYTDNESFKVIRCKSLSAPEKYRLALPSFDAKFRKAVLAEKPDVIHIQTPFTLAEFALKYGKKHKIPVVLTLHTKYKIDFERALHGFKPLVWFMMKYIMRKFAKADSVWTVNDATAKVLRQYGFKGDIEVVHNGTDFVYPENAAELIAKVDGLHNLKGQKNVFLFVGRIAAYKNIWLLADALKILKDAGEDFRMIVVGSGFDEVKYKKRIKELGLEDRFIFTGSVKDRELLQAYYLRSDLFLFPSTFDTAALVAIEAAAHKCPSLLIKGCCAAERITDNMNGFLSEETAEAFAARIKEIISDEELLKKVGEEAHRSVYRSWETVAAEAAEKYKRVIAEYKEKHKEKFKDKGLAQSSKRTKTKIKVKKQPVGN